MSLWLPARAAAVLIFIYHLDSDLYLIPVFDFVADNLNITCFFIFPGFVDESGLQ
jgi:hypothetical protein